MLYKETISHVIESYRLVEDQQEKGKIPIVGNRNIGTSGEDIEDFICAAVTVICKMYRTVKR
jgi:hypothetical protein